MKVTKNKIKQLETGKKIHDGRGLYFFKKGDKGRWSFRYQRDGRCHEMGCGTYPEISISMAREKRESYKKDKQAFPMTRKFRNFGLKNQIFARAQKSKKLVAVAESEGLVIFFWPYRGPLAGPRVPLRQRKEKKSTLVYII